MAAVAQLAGVSTATVSKVLNGQTGVGPETRRRVEALLREHGYRRPQVTQPTAAIEVVFYAFEGDMAMQIVDGVERVASKHDLAVVFTNANNRANGSRSWSEQVLARRPLGVISVHSHFTPEQHEQLAVSGIPLVALDPMGEPWRDTPSVGAANWNGGVMAARHLVELGHRRIAVISGPTTYLCARARLESCRAALDTSGAPLDDRLVRSGRFQFVEGLRMAEELLQVDDRPTAIVCGNDLQALGALEAVRRAGLTVPGDVSIVGFDDLAIARWTAPPLTTVRQPFADMGEAAAEMVLSLAAGTPLNQNRVELATTLIVRDSTAPPRPARHRPA